ncbi:MAG TPA: hypothetical protein VLM05_02390 [Mycobacteriales bacterium]|nr:hypothetical protein [Mycobacteriales bacterium]
MRIREPFLVVLAAAAGGAALWLIAYTLHYRAELGLCVVVGLAAGLTWRLSRLVVPPPEPAPVVVRAEPPDDGLLLLTTLESRLSWGAHDPHRFRERVRPELVALATDLLRTRRGVDLRREPEQARHILGEPLWQLMTGPLERSPSRAQLSRAVAALEGI